MSEPKILLKSTYKNFTYLITYNLYWYCAYIVIPPSHPFFCIDYSIIYDKINCHGGLSYSNHNPLIDEWCIGWDYGHFNYYIPNLSDDELLGGHRWTPKEIENECIDVIEQLINAESH